MDELFYNINDDNKNKLLQQFEVYFREYNKDEVILSSIKNDHIICAVIYGHIQIVKNNFNGDRIIIEDLEDNSLFGSMSSNIGNTQYEIITKEKTKIMIIYLPFNHSDLADYLAINRSAMARELKNLKDEGLIEIKGKKIKLLYYI